MNVRFGSVFKVCSKWGFINLVALRKEINRDMDGSLSVLPTPGGIPSMF